MLQKIKNKPLVSVIVPAFNEEKYIEECLVSIKGQTYPNIELIVIDDGSTDSTKQISQKYADVFLTQHHQGPGTARNKAAEVAKGEILVFIDADMSADKNFVKYIVNPILLNKVKATYTTQEFVANSKNIWSRCFMIDNNLKNNSRISAKNISGNKFFRAILRSIFLSMKGFDISKGYEDDKNFSSNKNLSIVEVNAILYHFNPDTLKDVFLSARWIGRSPTFGKTTRNLLRYSILNSILICIKKINEGAPLRFFVYKCIFDFGILCGILFKNIDSNYAK